MCLTGSDLVTQLHSGDVWLEVQAVQEIRRNQLVIAHGQVLQLRGQVLYRVRFYQVDPVIAYLQVPQSRVAQVLEILRLQHDDVLLLDGGDVQHLHPRPPQAFGPFHETREGEVPVLGQVQAVEGRQVGEGVVVDRSELAVRQVERKGSGRVEGGEELLGQLPQSAVTRVVVHVQLFQPPQPREPRAQLHVVPQAIHLQGLELHQPGQGHVRVSHVDADEERLQLKIQESQASQVLEDVVREGPGHHPEGVAVQGEPGEVVEAREGPVVQLADGVFAQVQRLQVLEVAKRPVW